MWAASESGDLVGWLLTRHNRKLGHVTSDPFVSCSYWDPEQHTVVAECRATRCDPSEAWDQAVAAPPPMGYDPATVPGLWASPTDPGCAALRFDPWFVRAWTIGSDPLTWRAAA